MKLWSAETERGQDDLLRSRLERDDDGGLREVSVRLGGDDKVVVGGQPDAFAFLGTEEARLASDDLAGGELEAAAGIVGKKVGLALARADENADQLGPEALLRAERKLPLEQAVEGLFEELILEVEPERSEELERSFRRMALTPHLKREGPPLRILGGAITDLGRRQRQAKLIVGPQLVPDVEEDVVRQERERVLDDGGHRG